MKKKSTLLVVLLSFVCLVCAAIGLTACTDNGDKTVIKVGDTKIGTVTTDGSTYSVEGEEDKEYVITAKTGDEVCSDVLITYTAGTSINAENGSLKITYAKDSTLKFSTLSDEVKDVTVVMEVYVAPVIPEKTIHTLTVDTPVVLDVIDTGVENYVSVKFETVDGMTYTVSSSVEGVKFVGKGSLDGNQALPQTFLGSDYVDFNNVATIELTADSKLENVTISLSVKTTEVNPGPGPEVPEYDAITEGTTVVTTFPDENEDGDPAHYYTFVVAADTTYSVKADGFVKIGDEAVDGSFGETTQTVTLTAGTYTVMVVDYLNADVNITITAVS
ncbi:MAG: hypothetical protein K2N22_06015 [Clostridia bacterium]|nr:hypothetical protein [Clostridia bacterium]